MKYGSHNVDDVIYGGKSVTLMYGENTIFSKKPGKIYCPEDGGTAMHIYDIASDSWSTGADAPASAYRYTSQLYMGQG